jgi:16S rRNA processing protein RimM
MSVHDSLAGEADQSPTDPGKKAPEHLIIGQVVAPFGIRGELKVNIVTEFPERLRKLKRVTLTPFRSIEPGLAPTAALDPSTVKRDWSARGARKGPESATSYQVASSQIHRGQMVLKLEGVASVEDAEVLRGYWVVIPIEEVPALPSGAYYLYQIVGLEVYTTEGTHIGKIVDVITSTANDVYVVKGPGVTEPSGELLIPAIKLVVRLIDVEGGRLEIAPLEEWT